MTDFLINIKSIKKKSVIISGVATSNRLDRHGESITISPNAYKNAINNYQKKDGKVYMNNQPIGLVIAYEHELNEKFFDNEFTVENIKQYSGIKGMTTYTEYTPSDYSIDSPEILNMKIKFVAEVWDKEMIDDLLAQRLNKASLRWTTKNWLRNEKTKQRIDTEVILKELSLVKEPANPDAVFSVVTDEDLAKQYKLGERVKVYDTLANIKSLYTDGSHYYVDVDFVDEIVNIKSANKIPVEAIDTGFKVNIKSRFIVNIKSSKTYSNYPDSASNNAKKAIKWREEHGDRVKGGTQVGWTRANQLANREALSESTVKRIKSFLARHEKNAEVGPKFKDEPWRDAGHVAYLIWGGKSMKNWVDSLSL